MKVSVCIPVYGVEKYIERCARSLFEQTMTEDIEFIFVNDCTKDNSIEVLEKVLTEYPQRKEQVKIIHHKENRGVSAARRTALQAASGEYIIFCDSDDWVDQNLYQTMYLKAMEDNADMVCCAIALEREGKTPFVLEIPYKTVDEMIKKGFNSAKYNSLWHKMTSYKIVKESLECVPDDVIMAEDLLLVTQMLLKCQKISVCNDICYHYFFANPNSVTLNLNRKTMQSEITVAKIMKDILPPKYKKFALALKGQALFSALSTAGISSDEFFSIYGRRIIPKIMFAGRLTMDKRLLINTTLISYPLAKALCKLRIQLVKMIRS